jgi:protein tyrosine/serine phosphatase
MKLRSLLLLGSLLGASPAAAEISRFGEVTPRKVYRGSRPTEAKDFLRLQRLGIKTIVSLQLEPWAWKLEQERAKKYGIRLIDQPIEAWTFEPSEEQVNAAVEALADPKNQPVYVHCKLGRDRTGLVVGLYRIYHEHRSSEAAFAEMRRYGFSMKGYLAGLYRYFLDHDRLDRRGRMPAR